jgi:hypothetical protein
MFSANAHYQYVGGKFKHIYTGRFSVRLPVQRMTCPRLWRSQTIRGQRTGGEYREVGKMGKVTARERCGGSLSVGLHPRAEYKYFFIVICEGYHAETTKPATWK